MTLLPMWIMALLHLRVGLSLDINPTTGITRPERSPNSISSFKGELLEWTHIGWLAPVSPKGKPLGSQMGN